MQQHPNDFGSSFEEEQHADLSYLIGAPPNLTLGGFANDTLAGTAAMIVSPRLKQRHKGHVVAVYVAPSWRRTGLAPALLNHLIAEARTAGLLLLTLSVTVGNTAARQLYLSAGFVPYGVEPLCLKVGSDLFDAEFMALKLA